jgi:hypothetical protein
MLFALPLAQLVFAGPLAIPTSHDTSPARQWGVPPGIVADYCGCWGDAKVARSQHLLARITCANCMYANQLTTVTSTAGETIKLMSTNT